MTASDPVKPFGAWLFDGFRDGFGVPALIIISTMCGIGGLVRDIGYPVWAGTISTLLIWAGPAQVLLFAAVGSSAALPATAFAIALSSARFLPMTVSLLPLIRGDGIKTRSALFASHFVSMTTWVEGLRRLPNVPAAGRFPFFLGYSSVIFSAAILATHFGYYLYAVLPQFLAAGFLFTTPLFFAASMIASARVMSDWVALCIGFFITPFIAPLLPNGFDFLIIGLVGGTIAFMLWKRWR